MNGAGRSSTFRGGEESLHSIKIALWNRIVLMVVAARTTDRQSEEDLRGCSRDFVKQILAKLRLEVGVRLPGAHTQKAHRDQPLVAILAAVLFSTISSPASCSLMNRS